VEKGRTWELANPGSMGCETEDTLSHPALSKV